MKKTPPPTAQARIAARIRALRQERGLTQAGLAKALRTSQSAVARMEAGKQNFSAREIEKVGQALGAPLIGVPQTADLVVRGGRRLAGSIDVNCSKNGSVALLCAALLNRGKTTLRGIARIEEVHRLVEILESVGVTTRWAGQNVLEVEPPARFELDAIDVAAASRVRSSLMLIGALAHRVPRFALPHAGGCKMGNRTIAAHRFGLAALGVSIETREAHYDVATSGLRAADVVMYEASDTAAINLLLAAAYAPGVTTVRFAPPNYQVQEVCFFLEKLGVRVEGIGTTTLVVHGAEPFSGPLEHENSEDPIEAMLLVSAAATTRSALEVRRVPIDFMSVELAKLAVMGLRFSVSPRYKARNGRTDLVDVKVRPSKLVAPPDKLHALPYPGLNADNLPFFVPIATQAEGTTLIHDWMWENRAIYFAELSRLGASVALADPHRVFVTGPSQLRAAQVVAPPALRPAAVILIAMLAAEGTSVLRNVYPINRGYEEIAARLRSIGADVEPAGEA